MSLRIYDSLSRSLVDFTPRDPGKVTIYACGLTPQAPAHLGHMRGAVLFDVIRNWLEYSGLEVDFVQNFTDIDDKIIRRSAEEGISASEVAEKYGVWVEKSMYGKTFWGIERTTFLIGADGRIERVFPNVKPQTHSEQVLSALAELEI